MIAGLADPVVIFMVGATLALLINYPDARLQRERIDAHARAALLMAAILFAAGAFTGIMTGSGMIGAMAQAAAHRVPESLGGHLPVMMGAASMRSALSTAVKRSSMATIMACSQSGNSAKRS